MFERNIFHQDFQPTPFWWEAYRPESYPCRDLPKETVVAIIGGGYSGLSAALELTRFGIQCCILESESPGYFASSRSGGIVAASGGLKAPLVSRATESVSFQQRVQAAADGFELVSRLIDEENIDCEWVTNGYLRIANTKRQLAGMAMQIEKLTEYAGVKSQLIDHSLMTGVLGTDHYRGGLLTKPGGHLHPSLYFRGLLQAVEKKPGVTICSQCKVKTMRTNRNGWELHTEKGVIQAEQVIVATNGYTGDATPTFKKRIIPLSAYIVATEILDEEVATALSPQNVAFVDSKRIVSFFRLTGKKGEQRLIFGSRVKWQDISATEMAPLLYQRMTEIFPKLKDYKMTHAWSGNVAITLDEKLHNGKIDGLYYAMGCNGSGVANMTYLGTQVARQLMQSEHYTSPFGGEFPDSRFYNGNQRWFVPLIGRYLMFRDWVDQQRDRLL